MRHMPSSSQGPSAEDIDRLILDAQLRAIPDNIPKLPWETGPFKAIYEDDSQAEFPTLKQPSLVPLPGEQPPPVIPKIVCAGEKRKFANLFSYCSAKDDQDEEDDEAKLWVIALAKWVSIFALIHHEGSVGEQLQQSFWADEGPTKEEVLRDVLGARAPRTAIKRANSMLKCLQWHLDKADCAWPWTLQSLSSFVDSLKGARGEASAVQSLFEAVRFSKHVLGIPFEVAILEDKRLQGRAKRLQYEGPDIQQAEVLSVDQVCKLESRVVDPDTCVMDKYLIGGQLFALYSRSRWSDLRYIHCIHLDKNEDGAGFVEARTRIHKTRRSKKAVRKAMPLVMPIFGLHDIAWAAWVDAWWSAGLELGVDWDKIPFGPLVRASSQDGYLMRRACTSTEASLILCSALDLDRGAGGVITLFESHNLGLVRPARF